MSDTLRERLHAAAAKCARSLWPYDAQDEIAAFGALFNEAATALSEREESWLNDVGSAYSPCVEHQPEAWEGDGTCVICEGQRLRSRVIELETALQGMLGISRGRVNEYYTHVMVRAADFNAGVAALVPDETPSSANSEEITPHEVAHLALTRNTDAS